MEEMEDLMEDEVMSFALWMVGIYYGVYVLISILVTWLMYRVVVLPVLRSAPPRYTKHVKPRKIACLWGFWIFWQYVVAVVLLVFWKTLLAILCPLCRRDLRTISFWTAKEQRFLQSTPFGMYADWVREYFARFYPPASCANGVP
jgi:hypothetical protein